MLQVHFLRTVFILVLGLSSGGAVEFSESRSGVSSPSDTYEVNFGEGLQGRRFNIYVKYSASGNVTGTVSAFGTTVAIGEPINLTTKATSGRVVVRGSYADGDAHCWSSNIVITVTPSDDGADVVCGSDSCGVEIRRSYGTSWVDNLRESHVHDAWDLRTSGLGAGGCSPCGGSGSSADGWGLHRLHRYRDMAWRGSFGPGVFHQFDHQLRVTGRDAGLVVEYFDPEGAAPMVLRPTGVVGVCEDRRFRQIRSLTFRAADEQATSGRQEATWADLECVDGRKLRFEIIPPPADQPEGLGFGRFVREISSNGERQYTISYEVPVRPNIREDQVINWWGSEYWKIRQVADGPGRILSFTYQEDLGLPVVATASDGSVTVVYSYEVGNERALIGLTGVRYADGSQSTFNIARDGAWWLLTYDDAGASGVHQRNTIALTGSKSIALVNLGSGGVVGLPIATYPNRVRRVWNGQGEVVWSGFCANEGNGRYVGFVEEAGVAKSVVYENGKVTESRISTDPLVTDDPRKKSWVVTTAYGTDAAGRVNRVTDALGRSQDRSLDARHGGITQRRLRAASGAVMDLEITEFNERRQPLRRQDANGVVTRWTYDNQGRVLSHTAGLRAGAEDQPGSGP